MVTIIVFHEVNDGNIWAKAWHKGPGSRHELFAQYGFKARTFRDPENANNTGLIIDVPDIETWKQVLSTDVGQKAMAEDGLKVDTLRMLAEFTP